MGCVVNSHYLELSKVTRESVHKITSDGQIARERHSREFESHQTRRKTYGPGHSSDNAVSKTFIIHHIIG